MGARDMHVPQRPVLWCSIPWCVHTRLVMQSRLTPAQHTAITYAPRAGDSASRPPRPASRALAPSLIGVALHLTRRASAPLDDRVASRQTRIPAMSLLAHGLLAPSKQGSHALALIAGFFASSTPQLAPEP